VGKMLIALGLSVVIYKLGMIVASTSLVGAE
jgi:hypothetical protein